MKTERNQVATLITLLATAISLDKLDEDLQVLIEAIKEERDQVGSWLTEGLRTRAWCKLAPVVEPQPTFTLKVEKIHEGKDFLDGKTFMEKARALPGAMNGDKKAFEYYSKSKHWAEMNVPDGITVIVFADTEFGSGVSRYVRYLYRNGAEWSQDYFYVGSRFFSSCGVATLASKVL